MPKLTISSQRGVAGVCQLCGAKSSDLATVTLQGSTRRLLLCPDCAQKVSDDKGGKGAFGTAMRLLRKP